MINALRTKRIELDLPIDVLAALSGIPASSLSLADRGTRDLPIDRFRQADAILDELKELVRFCAPVPIAWKNVNAIRELLDRMRRSRCRPSVDALDLLREITINGGNLDAVLTKRGCSPQQLRDQLSHAGAQLNQMARDLAARNADDIQLNAELHKQTTL